MNSWAFPPDTRKVQLDEKWSFVYKKEKNCDWEADPGDLFQGDQYGHVALDPDSRLVLSVLVGKRLANVTAIDVPIDRFPVDLRDDERLVAELPPLFFDQGKICACLGGAWLALTPRSPEVARAADWNGTAVAM